MNEQNISPERAAQTDNADDGENTPLRELAKQFTLDEQKVKPVEKPTDKKSDEKAKPKNLAELAERLKLEVSDLYDLEIPSDKLKGLTLGKLKDHMVERENFTVASLKFEEDKAKKESEFIQQQQELQALMSMLPKDSLKPETLKAAKEKHQAFVRSERIKTLEIIPEWQNESIRNQELVGIIEHLKGYGFPENYLESIVDSRAIRYIRENWQRKMRIDKAIAAAVERKPVNAGKSKPGGAAERTDKTSKPRTREEQEISRYLHTLNNR